MKFKDKAAESAIYKILGLICALSYAYAGILFLITLAAILLTEETTTSTRLAIFLYILGGIFFSIIGEFLRSVRKDMVEE